MIWVLMSIFSLIYGHYNQHCIWIQSHRAPTFGHFCLDLSFKDIWTIDSPQKNFISESLDEGVQLSRVYSSTRRPSRRLYSSSSAARRQQAPSNSYLCWCNSFWFISPSEKGGFQPPATPHRVLCQTTSPLEGRRQQERAHALLRSHHSMQMPLFVNPGHSTASLIALSNKNSISNAKLFLGLESIIIIVF